MKKNPWLLRPIFLVLLIFCVVTTLVSFFLNHIVFYVELAGLLLLLAYIFLESRSTSKQLRRLLSQMGETLNPTNKSALDHFPMPVLLVSGDGEILWHNGKVEKTMTADHRPCVGKSIGEFFNKSNWWEACQSEGWTSSPLTAAALPCSGPEGKRAEPIPSTVWKIPN